MNVSVEKCKMNSLDHLTLCLAIESKGYSLLTPILLPLHHFYVFTISLLPPTTEKHFFYPLVFFYKTFNKCNCKENFKHIKVSTAQQQITIQNTSNVNFL